MRSPTDIAKAEWEKFRYGDRDPDEQDLVRAIRAAQAEAIEWAMGIADKEAADLEALAPRFGVGIVRSETTAHRLAEILRAKAKELRGADSDGSGA